MKFNVILLLAALFVSGCANQPAQIANPRQSLKLELKPPALLAVDTIKATTEAELFYLSPEQQSDFDTFYQQQQAKGQLAHHILYDYLDRRLDQFTYDGLTYTASQSLNNNRGNCMSLAILTTALAKRLGLEFDYQQVNSVPIFNQQGNLLLASAHVQTRLFDPTFIKEEGYIYLAVPSIIIDYFPELDNVKGQRVDYRQFLAMYYRNIAADALVKEQLARAYVYAEKAYQWDETSMEVRNLLAVIYRRSGELAMAEKIYQHSSQLPQVTIALLNNYKVLLNQLGKKEQADELEQRIAGLDDPNPYRWLEQAYAAHRAGENYQAITYYQQVLKQAPYVYQAYAGLVKIYHHQGRTAKARKTIEQALEWSSRPDERQRFKAKLYSLQHHGS